MDLGERNRKGNRLHAMHVVELALVAQMGIRPVAYK